MAKSCSLLIIDDNPDDREFYIRALRNIPDQNYDITEAADGAEGLALLNSTPFDCILLDYSLPGLNGLQVLQSIRFDHPHMAVIMLTGQGDITVAVQSIKEKANDYLTKSSDLTSRLHHAIILAIDNATVARKADLSQRYLREMLNHIPDPIFMKDENHRWVDGNAAFWDFMKGTADQFIGKTDHDLFPAEEAAAVRASEQRLFLSGETAVCQESCTDLIGGHHILFTKKGVFRDHEDRKLLVGVMHDITLLKEQQAALAASEQTFRQAIENAVNGMALVAPDGQWLQVNRALCQLLGYSERDLTMSDMATVTHKDDLAADEACLSHIWEEERGIRQYEKRFVHSMGHVITVLQSISVVRHKDGAPHYLVVQMLDLTETRKMDRIKSEFISTVSHELRTPLTSIRGSLGLIAQPFAGELSAAGRELIEIAGENCERLIMLINDILDIDKIAAGEMRFDIQTHKVSDLVGRAIKVNQSYAEKFGVTIESTEPSRTWKIRADEARFVQVMSNLISNAVKFAGDAQKVLVHAKRKDRKIRICVTDRGAGIPEEFHARIFEKFAQADSSVARKKEGSGLGLHISRQLIEAMGGQIGFDSEAGVGTTFWIEFSGIGI